MNHGLWFALVDRHVERVKHERGTQMRGHRPTNDAAAEDIEDNG
jgi:hypothetical protein